MFLSKDDRTYLLRTVRDLEARCERLQVSAGTQQANSDVLSARVVRLTEAVDALTRHLGVSLVPEPATLRAVPKDRKRRG